MQIFKKKPFTFPKQVNKGGVNEWLTIVGNHKKELLALADKVPHDCFSCWWFQFADVANTRVCRTPGKLNVVPERNVCLCWRVDPNALNRARGRYYGLIK